MRDVELRDPVGIHKAFAGIQYSEAYAIHAERVAQNPQLFTPDVLELLGAAAKTTGWQHVRSLRARDQWRSEVHDLLSRVDLLATPTTCVVAPEVGQREIEIDGTVSTVRGALLSLAKPWNVAGLPAVSVPAGTIDGLPVGVQLACSPGQEDLLFAVAARIGT